MSKMNRAYAFTHTKINLMARDTLMGVLRVCENDSLYMNKSSERLSLPKSLVSFNLKHMKEIPTLIDHISFASYGFFSSQALNMSCLELGALL